MNLLSHSAIGALRTLFWSELKFKREVRELLLDFVFKFLISWATEIEN